MRSPSWMLHVLLVVHLCGHGRSDEVLQRARRSAAVHFAGDDRNSKAVKAAADALAAGAGASSPASWRYDHRSDANQLLQSVRQPKSETSDGDSNQRGLSKKGRKAEAARDGSGSVQDIISGIVQLLGGKVNLNAAKGSGLLISSGSKSSSIVPSGSMRLPPKGPPPTRINNRGPPRLTPVPFEAIPLQPGNSANSAASASPASSKFPGSHGQLPFGVPLHPPLWAQTLNPGPGQNVQGLPFPSGIPLPVQLVPPINFSRPLPSSASTSTSTLPSSSTTIAVTSSASPILPQSSSSSSSSSADAPTSKFRFPDEESGTVAAATVTTSVEDSSSSTEVPILHSSMDDTALLSSIASVIHPVTLTTSSPEPSSVASSAWTTASSALPHWDVMSSEPSRPDSNSGLSRGPALTSATPPLPYGRPGQVFNDDPKEPVVITHHDFISQQGGGETFELVVTAAQNFGGGAANGVAPPPSAAIHSGRPHVIPVDIDHIRGTGDEFVSIDTRKTYFNLFPTNVAPSTPVIATPSATIQSQAGHSGGYGTYGINRGQGQVVGPSVSSSVHRVTAPVSPMRRPPTTTPIGRIDACIVGDPNACLEPNESCRADVDGSACSCKPGFGRRKTSDICKALAGFAVTLRLDKRDGERLFWASPYADPSSANYLQLEWESNQAINSLMESTPLADNYVSSAVNRFYAIGNKLAVNVTVFMEHSPATLAVTLRPTMKKLLADAIRRYGNQLGTSPLSVEELTSPVPLIQDLNECESEELNDCSLDAKCVNAPGTYSCHCRPGFSDPFAEDLRQSGRQCNTCTRSYCHNRGECRIQNGRKTCQCQGNYKGSQCELDGEVLGVAVGASVAAVFIIILTLVLLCMWSRRWRQTQDKIERNAYANGSHHMKHMSLPAMMHDRIRWAQYAEAMAAQSQNLYAQPFHCDFAYPTGGSALAPSLPAPNVPPPPIPCDSKRGLRQASSLPISLTTSSLAGHVVGAYHGIQQLARKISRKTRRAAAPNGRQQPDPVNVNPHLALISPPYPVGTMSSLGRTSLAPTLPLGPYHKSRSTAGSIHSLTGKRCVPPPPPSQPPPGLRGIDTSDDSAEESDVTVERSFRVPRPRSRSSRSSALSRDNIYFEVDFPSNDFSTQSQHSINHSMNQYRNQQVAPQRHQPTARYYYR